MSQKNTINANTPFVMSQKYPKHKRSVHDEESTLETVNWGVTVKYACLYHNIHLCEWGVLVSNEGH